MSRFKMFAQLGEGRWQTPVAVDRCVIQVSRLPSERRQVVQRIQHLLALAIGPLVPGHEHAIADDFDAIDVGFYCDRGESVPPGHAVAILLPGNRLVLIDVTDFTHGGFKRTRWQRQGSAPLQRQACSDRFTLARDCPR